jgi:FMN phosphatase YigB (HAD superfamily)
MDNAALFDRDGTLLDSRDARALDAGAVAVASDAAELRQLVLQAEREPERIVT